MGIGNEASAHAQEGERFNLQVSCGCRTNVRLIHGNVAVVLLIHIEILNQARLDKVLETKFNHTSATQFNQAFSDF
jgi:hypothetical protein